MDLENTPSAIYKVRVYNHTFDLIGELDNWNHLAYYKRVNEIGSFNIVIDYLSSYREWFQFDNIVEILRDNGDGSGYRVDFTGFIRKAIWKEDDSGTISYEAYGLDVKELLSRRFVMYKTGTTQTNKAGTACDIMKEYVVENLGWLANNATRIRPGWLTCFYVDEYRGDGIPYKIERSYQNLHTVLKYVADSTGSDFDVVTNIAGKYFYFFTYPDGIGANKSYDVVNSATGKNSYGNRPIIFSVEEGNVITTEFSVDITDEKNVVYAGGQGTGEDRNVVYLENPYAIAISPFNRHESFSDARRLSEDASLMQECGDTIYENSNSSNKINADIRQKPGTLYNTDYDIGDIITIGLYTVRMHTKLTGIDIVVDKDVEKITHRFEGNYGVYRFNNV